MQKHQLTGSTGRLRTAPSAHLVRHWCLSPSISHMRRKNSCASGAPHPKESQCIFGWRSCGGHSGPLPPSIQPLAGLVARNTAPRAEDFPWSHPSGSTTIHTEPTGQSYTKRCTSVFCSPLHSPGHTMLCIQPMQPCAVFQTGPHTSPWRLSRLVFYTESSPQLSPQASHGPTKSSK